LLLLLTLCVVPGGYPRIIENPTLKSVEKDRNTVMICNAAGDPEPSIVWYKDYVPVDMSDPRRKLLPTGDRALFNHNHMNDRPGLSCAAFSVVFTANLTRV